MCPYVELTLFRCLKITGSEYFTTDFYRLCGNLGYDDLMTPKWHIQGIEALASFKSPDQWHYSKQPVKPDGPYFVPCTETDTLHFDDHQILTVMIGGICKTIEFRYQLGLRTAAIENGKFAISEQSIKLAFRPIILKS